MPPSPFHQDRLRQGHALQLQGRLGEAADIYRAVLAEDPRNAPALHLLGVLVMQAGQLEPGLEMVRQSLAILPDFAPAQENLGKGLEQLGRREEALAAYDRLVKLAPSHAEGYVHRSRVLESLTRYGDALRDTDKALSLKNDPRLLLNRGAILLQLQRPGDALTAFDKAIAAGLQHPAAFFNRGIALERSGRPDEALASYDEALLRQPDYADAFVNRGLVQEALQRPDEALLSYDRALAIDPAAPEANANRVAILARMGRREEALAGMNQAIAERPDDAMAYNNRGSVLKGMGEATLALADFDTALALMPDYAPLHSNRGVTLQSLMRYDEAMAAFDRALALDPASDSGQFNKAFLLLLLGRFAEGLPLYEKRLRQAGPPDLDPAKAWRGLDQNVAGKTVFVYAEQGLGDIMQFSRYLIGLSEMGAGLVLAVRDPMARLLRSLPVPVTLIAENTAPKAFDFHAPLLSLPLLFGTTLDTIPVPGAYLKAEPERAAAWRQRLGGHGFRVGVAWQGKTKGNNDPYRSFPLAALAPLAALPGVRLISLQKGEGSEQLDMLPHGMAVERPGEDFDAGFDAFIDSAAVMEACDLIVTCDTSIAHLAGALGRPTWTALRDVPDWRWLLERQDSPWYPSMTLYRQPRLEDWDSVFVAMARDLETRLAARS
jgi:tetratricopeptide (TPR) repeat protein